MPKFLKFNKTVIDMDTMVKFTKDNLYEVIFETDDHYALESQHDTPCGIGRECEGLQYDVVEKE